MAKQYVVTEEEMNSLFDQLKPPRQVAHAFSLAE